MALADRNAVVAFPAAAYSLRSATHADLRAINALVAAAVTSWQLPERVWRLALPSLCYSEFDLRYMSAVLAEEHASEIVGVMLWETEHQRYDAAPQCELSLHGIYVAPDRQRRGIGCLLIDEITRVAREQHANGISTKAWRGSQRFFLRLDFLPEDAGEVEPPLLYPRRLYKRV